MKINNLIILTLSVFINLTSIGQTTILTLDNVPLSTLCNDTWTEQNLDLSFVTGTSDDCGEGACYFGVEPTFVWLYPSRLTIDLSSLQNIQYVEVDVVSYCGIINPQCTYAFLMDSTGIILNNVENTINNLGSSINGDPETLILENPTEGFISELALSSCEGQVNEIRIYQNALSTDQIELDDEEITIYPNPTNGKLTIDFAGIIKNVEVVDMLGRSVLAPAAIGNKSVDATGLSTGKYMARITTDTNQILIKEFAVQK